MVQKLIPFLIAGDVPVKGKWVLQHVAHDIHEDLELQMMDHSEKLTLSVLMYCGPLHAITFIGTSVPHHSPLFCSCL